MAVRGKCYQAPQILVVQSRLHLSVCPSARCLQPSMQQITKKKESEMKMIRREKRGTFQKKHSYKGIMIEEEALFLDVSNSETGCAFGRIIHSHYCKNI